MLRTNSNLKQQDLAEILHVSQQAIAKWENGKSEPNVSMLKDIAKVFNCSVDNLLSNDNDILNEIYRTTIREVHSPVIYNFEKMCSELDEKTLDRIHTILYSIRSLQNNTDIFTGDKQYLFACIAEIIGKIELYVDSYQSTLKDSNKMNLSEYNKRFINGEVEVIKEIVNAIAPQNEPSNERKIVLPFYVTPASAGTGSWLSDEPPVEWITIPKNNKTATADFILEVRGDSMQPKFFNGDKVLIKQSNSIYEGEIGVFILNNESYIKKMGRGELISLNPAYDPIQLTELDDVRCAGKVIDNIVL
ncbi:MAG: helix-turn-helix domain-containing protein [Ruminococcus sp.]|nr:helix-turn-helix domain-containing protein [Ruminococcus sp.]